MWFGLVLLALIIDLSPSPASADGWLMGRVVSLDEDSRQFVMRVGEGAGGEAPGGRDVTVVLEPGEPFPRDFVPGRPVRVWVKADAASDAATGTVQRVVAQRITMMGQHRRGTDRTGVRSRLNAGRGRGMSGHEGRQHGR
jgi:hypothetical protein